MMMNKILWHAVSTGALIRSNPADSAPVVRSISQGNWLGVMKELGEWMYVISKESIGWVNRNELTLLATKPLHIKTEEGILKINYSI